MIEQKPNPPRVPTLLGIQEVTAMTSLSKGSIYRLMKTGRFPRAKALIPGGRRVAWAESDVLAWAEAPLDWGDVVAF